MPNRAARPCKHGGCTQTATDGRFCSRHAGTVAAVRPYDARRGSAHSRGYDADWTVVRTLALQRDQHLCVLCSKAGRAVRAQEVDHIVPIARGGARLDLANLQSLCKPCHSRKTATEDSGFARRRSSYGLARGA